MRASLLKFPGWASATTLKLVNHRGFAIAETAKSRRSPGKVQVKVQAKSSQGLDQLSCVGDGHK